MYLYETRTVLPRTGSGLEVFIRFWHGWQDNGEKRQLKSFDSRPEFNPSAWASEDDQPGPRARIKRQETVATISKEEG